MNKFFLISLLFLLLFILGPSLSLSSPHGQCRLAYHADSSGRGIEAGFKGQDLRPTINDESCYQQGVAEGMLLPKEDSICQQDFEAGKENGLQANLLTLGTSCSTKGYIAGQALLHVGAREANSTLVGQNCIDEYKRGVTDGNNNNVPTTSDDHLAAECYMTGFYDVSSSRPQ